MEVVNHFFDDLIYMGNLIWPQSFKRLDFNPCCRVEGMLVVALIVVGVSRAIPNKAPTRASNGLEVSTFHRNGGDRYQ